MVCRDFSPFFVSLYGQKIGRASFLRILRPGSDCGFPKETRKGGETEDTV
jgi:hypothetical protein